MVSLRRVRIEATREISCPRMFGWDINGIQTALRAKRLGNNRQLSVDYQSFIICRVGISKRRGLNRGSTLFT